MKRLLQIEFARLWSAKYFRVLLGLWILAFLVIPIAADAFLDFLESEGETPEKLGLTFSQLPIFDFEDIWQNMAYVYKNLGILLSFIIVISVTNDFDYKTFRQNVIDGLSRKEWLVSKLYLILFITTVSALLVFILGLVIGLCMSDVRDLKTIFANVEFIGAYWLQAFLFLNLCMLVALLIRRAGITLAVLIFWIYIFEPISSTLIAYWAEWPIVADLLPFEASWTVIPNPLLKYILRPSQDFIDQRHILVAGGYSLLSMWLSWIVIRKKDL